MKRGEELSALQESCRPGKKLLLNGGGGGGGVGEAALVRDLTFSRKGEKDSCRVSVNSKRGSREEIGSRFYVQAVLRFADKKN